MRNPEKYHENWKDEIRPSALMRAGFKCENCGVEHKKCYIFEKGKKPLRVDEEEMKEAKRHGEKAYKVHLQVSHKNHDTSNNEEFNLQVFCPSCHLRYDKEFHRISRKSRKN